MTGCTEISCAAITMSCWCDRTGVVLSRAAWNHHSSIQKSGQMMAMMFVDPPPCLNGLSCQQSGQLNACVSDCHKSGINPKFPFTRMNFAQIDWIPLSIGSVRPSQGRTLAVAQVIFVQHCIHVTDASKDPLLDMHHAWVLCCSFDRSAAA